MAQIEKRRMVPLWVRIEVAARLGWRPGVERWRVRCNWCEVVGNLVWWPPKVRGSGYVALSAGMEWDHLLPLARGGTTIPTNIVISCRRCNRSRCARLAEEWAA
jgi:hypothetical protein